jgi:hypothetical protein
MRSKSSYFPPFIKLSIPLLNHSSQPLFSSQDTIIKALPKLPYGLRYICMKLREDLKKKFPTAEDDEVLKVRSEFPMKKGCFYGVL